MHTENPGGIRDGSSCPPFSRTVAQRILLVEDHAATLEVMTRLLRRDGHDVITATTVAEGIAISRGRPLDLLVADLGLPDGSGAQLMILLRRTHGVRGIAMTGYGMEQDIAESKEAGFSAHATKPVDLATVRRLIAEVVLSRQGEKASMPSGPH